MTNALKNTLELFNLTKIDRDLYSWTGESVGFRAIARRRAQRTVLAVELRVANRMVGEDDSVQRKSEETRRRRVCWTFRLSGVDGGGYFVV